MFRVAGWVLTAAVVVAVLWLMSARDQLVTTLLSRATQNEIPKAPVYISTSTGTAALLELFRKANISPDSKELQFYANHLSEPQERFTGGEYRFAEQASLLEHIERVRNEDFVRYTVVVPRQASVTQVAQVFRTHGLGPEDLGTKLRDAEFAKTLGIPGPSCEGYLWGDVYRLRKGPSLPDLIQPLVKRTQLALAKLQTAGTRVFSEYEWVTLASLIESAPIPRDERRLYSALLQNRLKAGIALQHAAADQYGKSRAEEGDSDTWNTTNRPGLPSTPILTPSMGALRAALSPVDSPALYMVPRGDGTHVYCPDKSCVWALSKSTKVVFPKQFALD